MIVILKLQVLLVVYRSENKFSRRQKVLEKMRDEKPDTYCHQPTNVTYLSLHASVSKWFDAALISLSPAQEYFRRHKVFVSIFFVGTCYILHLSACSILRFTNFYLSSMMIIKCDN